MIGYVSLKAVLQEKESTADAREKDHRYNSERFARLSAKAFTSKGIKVYLLKGISATPLVVSLFASLRLRDTHL